MPRHDSDLYPEPLEMEIRSRIDDIIISLITQEKYCRGQSRISLTLDPRDASPFNRNDFIIPKPNYQALEAGFPGLRVIDSTLYYSYKDGFGRDTPFTSDFYFGQIRFEPPELIYVSKDKQYDLGGKRFAGKEIFELREILYVLYEVTEVQLRNVERILFLFET